MQKYLNKGFSILKNIEGRTLFSGKFKSHNFLSKMRSLFSRKILNNILSKMLDINITEMSWRTYQTSKRVNQANAFAGLQSLWSWVFSLAHAKHLFNSYPISKSFATHFTINVWLNTGKTIFYLIILKNENNPEKCILRGQSQHIKCLYVCWKYSLAALITTIKFPEISRIDYIITFEITFRQRGSTCPAQGFEIYLYALFIYTIF